MLQDLAFEDPALDADDAVGGLGFGGAVVDVGAQRVQRHAAFAIPFHARDFRAAEAAGDGDTDALGAQAHGRLHRALHGAAERDAALELLGDVFGDQLGVGFGLADLDEVQEHLVLAELGDVLAELLDVRALLADDHARAGGVNGDAALLVRTLDDDLGDAGLLQLLLDELADLDVFVQQAAEVGAVGVPAAVSVRLTPRRNPIGLIF